MTGLEAALFTKFFIKKEFGNTYPPAQPQRSSVSQAASSPNIISKTGLK